MKTYIRLLLTFLVSVNLACQSTSEKQPADAADPTSKTLVDKGTAASSSSVVIQRLSPTDFATKLQALPNEQLIDVRTPDEYQSGHLPHSTLINFKDDGFREEVAQLNKKRPVMVYCAAGGRSTATVALLRELGFTEVYELEGGITRWREAGQELK